MDPIPDAGNSTRAARRVLAVAALILVGLYAVESRGVFKWLLNPQPVTAPDLTGPFVKGSDSIAYYAWLRSPLLDGDLQFDDEFAATFTRVPGSEASMPWTPTGHRPNHWPVGPAIVWAPAVATVHGVLTALGSRSPWPADGYSPPYQLAVSLTTLAAALLTLLFTCRIARRFAQPAAAAVAASLIVLATPIVAYGTVEVAIRHGPATGCLAAYVFVWLRSLGSLWVRRWAAVGALLGLACLMRWQLATFAILPALEAAWLARSGRAGGVSPLFVSLRLLVAAVASLLVFTPQLVGMQIVYGSPLGGVHQTGHNWLNPPLWLVLGSTDRSFFYWTPITLLSVAGLLHLARSNRVAAMLAVAVAAQVYGIATVMGAEVGLGWSFGFRYLTEACVCLVPGVAVLFARSTPRTARFLAVAGGVLVGWNLMLLGVYRHNLGMSGDPAEVFQMVVRFVRLRPLEGIVTLLTAGGFLAVTVGALRVRPETIAATPVVETPQRLAA